MVQAQSRNRFEARIGASMAYTSSAQMAVGPCSLRSQEDPEAAGLEAAGGGKTCQPRDTRPRKRL